MKIRKTTSTKSKSNIERFLKIDKLKITSIQIHYFLADPAILDILYSLSKTVFLEQVFKS